MTQLIYLLSLKLMCSSNIQRVLIVPYHHLQSGSLVAVRFKLHVFTYIEYLFNTRDVFL